MLTNTSVTGIECQVNVNVKKFMALFKTNNQWITHTILPELTDAEFIDGVKVEFDIVENDAVTVDGNSSVVW